jgi:hypothetical protein
MSRLHHSCREELTEACIATFLRCLRSTPGEWGPGMNTIACLTTLSLLSSSTKLRYSKIPSRQAHSWTCVSKSLTTNPFFGCAVLHDEERRRCNPMSRFVISKLKPFLSTVHVERKIARKTIHYLHVLGTAPSRV